jgi:hypothetical protein
LNSPHTAVIPRLVAGVHVLSSAIKDGDGRDKPFDDG